VWIGYRDKEIPMHGIRGCGAMTGGCLPAMTWRSFMSAALDDVPVTDFNEPAPIRLLAEELNRQRRLGIDPGSKRDATGTDGGGPYVVGPAPPEATAPATTTTTLPPEEDADPTDPFDDDDDDDDGGLIPATPD
jgi:membrane peptidoglycan carboxypeptidase